MLSHAVWVSLQVIEGEDSRSSGFKQKSPEEALAERLSGDWSFVTFRLIGKITLWDVCYFQLLK